MGKQAPRHLPTHNSHVPTSDPLGIYVHIPFCSAICNYCNFNRGLFDADLKIRYVEALRTEIARSGASEDAPYSERIGAPEDAPYSERIGASEDAPYSERIGASEDAPYSERIGAPEDAPYSSIAPPRTDVGHVFRRAESADTIFFGGGTPSLLEPDEIASIIQAVRDNFDLNQHSEITLETNPETVDGAKLERFRAAGVNRLSFGVQSFQDEELKRLGRIHSADRARAAMREARAAGFDNVSLDLMMWLPGQSVDGWLANVDGLIAARPDHASLYLLELYPNAPLKEDMARGGWSLAPDDDAAEMYLRAMSKLEEAGLRQYEISNVARSGRESRHNLKYWSDGEWLGFGCGAHSTRAWPAAASAETAGVRWKNVSGTVDYIDRVMAGIDPVADRRTLTGADRAAEALFTGLRLSAGVDLERFAARYGVDVWARYGDELQPFLDAGHAIRQGPMFRLTRTGMLIANEVMAVFV